MKNITYEEYIFNELSVGNDRGFLIFGSEIDCLIATWCIEHGVPLLFSDRDYEPFVEHLGLRAA